MHFDATLNQLGRMLAHVRAGILQSGLDDEQQLRTELAIEEALVNIIRHAYPQGEGALDLAWEVLKPRGLTVTICDHGVFFNPLELAPPSTLDSSLEERPTGGLGVFLIRQLLDDVAYHRDGDQNILTLTKRG